MFKEYSEGKGMQKQLMILCTPQQNDIAKCKTLALLDIVRSMMAHVRLPVSFWGDTILTVAYILNRVLSKSICQPI